MSKPLKQIVSFSFSNSDAVREANAWLSARKNDKYTTEVQVVGGEYACITIIYWEDTP